MTMTKLKDIIVKVIVSIWMAASVLVVLVPVFWMITAAFTKGRLLSSVPLFPDVSKFSVEHFQYIFSYKSNVAQPFPDYLGAFVRTLSIALINTVGVIFFSVITGYVFARRRFKGKKKMLLGIMILQMFPSFMGMVALFLLYRTFGLLKNPNYLAMIYTAGAIPYNTFLVRGFMKNIPMSLDEAAAIDGATPMQVLRTILLPLIVPIIGFIGVSAFMAPWLDFILQNAFLQAEQQTVAMWLFRTTDELAPLYYNPLRFMAGALLIAIPIMVVQLSMQKFMVHGLTQGADKG